MNTLNNELKTTPPALTEEISTLATPQLGLTNEGTKPITASLEEVLESLRVVLEPKWEADRQRLMLPSSVSSNITELPVKRVRPLSLSENPMAIQQFVHLLQQCYLTLDLYGRDISQMETVIKVFIEVLGEYPAEKCLSSVKKHLRSSPKFPTPSDLIKFI